MPAALSAKLPRGKRPLAHGPSMTRAITVETAADREVTGLIERVIADVPPARSRAVDHPDRAAAEVARAAAQKAAIVSGSLALPPGPLGMLTVLPDIYAIWHIQRQMVADIFGLYGRTASSPSATCSIACSAMRRARCCATSSCARDSARSSSSSEAARCVT